MRYLLRFLLSVALLVAFGIVILPHGRAGEIALMVVAIAVGYWADFLGPRVYEATRSNARRVVADVIAAILSVVTIGFFIAFWPTIEGMGDAVIIALAWILTVVGIFSVCRRVALGSGPPGLGRI